MKKVTVKAFSLIQALLLVCFSTVNISSGKNSYLGGLVGVSRDSNFSDMENSYWAGTAVTAGSSSKSGGLIGSDTNFTGSGLYWTATAE